MALHRERNGTLENIRLDEPAVLRPFQRKDVTPARIHHHQFHVLLGVEVAVAHDKLIVAGVQRSALRRPFIVVLRLVAVKPLV